MSDSWYSTTVVLQLLAIKHKDLMGYKHQSALFLFIAELGVCFTAEQSHVALSSFQSFALFPPHGRLCEPDYNVYARKF